MAQHQRITTPPPITFVVVAVAVVLVADFLGWRVYNAPIEPDEAGFVATQATEVTVKAAEGDASVCAAMKDVTSKDAAAAVVERCEQVASQAAANGPGPLDVGNLQVNVVDVDRNSGKVTIDGTLNTPNGAQTTSFTWPVGREDGHWYVTGGADVKVG